MDLVFSLLIVGFMVVTSLRLHYLEKFNDRLVKAAKNFRGVK
jgi:hypothetical protein